MREAPSGAAFRCATGAVAWLLCIALYLLVAGPAAPGPAGLSFPGVDQAALIACGSFFWEVISMRRGLAFSATGIRSVRTPAS